MSAARVGQARRKADRVLTKKQLRALNAALSDSSQKATEPKWFEVRYDDGTFGDPRRMDRRKRTRAAAEAAAASLRASGNYVRVWIAPWGVPLTMADRVWAGALNGCEPKGGSGP